MWVFAGRRPLELGIGGPALSFEPVPYANIPGIIGTAVGRRLTTLHEAQTIYGLEDIYDLIEIAIVDAHNEQQAEEAAKALR